MKGLPPRRRTTRSRNDRAVSSPPWAGVRRPTTLTVVGLIRRRIPRARPGPRGRKTVRNSNRAPRCPKRHAAAERSDEQTHQPQTSRRRTTFACDQVVESARFGRARFGRRRLTLAAGTRLGPYELRAL